MTKEENQRWCKEGRWNLW